MDKFPTEEGEGRKKLTSKGEKGILAPQSHQNGPGTRLGASVGNLSIKRQKAATGLKRRNMKITLKTYTQDPVGICEEAAAICVRGKPSVKSLKRALASGHESVCEHASFTFRIEGVSRVLLAQLTRHRLAAFSVESERYVNSSDNSVILPSTLLDLDNDLAFEVADLVADARNLYDRLIEADIAPEDARYILLQGTETAILFTADARELRHIFSLRCCNRAQKEIRDAADEMWRLVYEVAPELFEDCGPGCMRDGCKEVRPCRNPRKKENIFGG